MSYLDIAIVIPFLYSIIKGFTNGLIKEVTGLIAFVFGVYFAINFSVYLEPKISTYFMGYEEFTPIITFVILFAIIILSIRSLGFILDKLTKALALGTISKFLGAVFGFLKILLMFCFLIFIVKDNKLINLEKFDKTVLLKPIENISAQIMPSINKHKQDVIDKIDKKTKKAKEKINLE
tara:strand:+ start:195 stop:731 length:537 start_codon:yes stop_codon:yes gene_type:complete